MAQGSGVSAGTIVKDASAKTITAAPGLPVNGMMARMVLCSQSFQFNSKPGNCRAKATFSMLAFHLSSVGMVLRYTVLWLLERNEAFRNWMVWHE